MTDALERTGYMTPQHMMLIDTILTMPGTTVEKEYQRRIAAINAVIAFCDAERGLRGGPISPKKKATPSMPGMPHYPLLLLKDSSLPLKTRVIALSGKRSRQFASNLQIKDRRFAFSVLEIPSYRKKSDWRCSRTLAPSAGTLSTHIKPFPRICIASVRFAEKNLKARRF